ncbi:MAG TPA: antitoxin Xre/MbcA/ParS toxin-binding domain-containing protein [Longimicrobium sp.]|nr:antitoxin Xre/MbcA/ParS toxin-binding domain-containing protein [Longimicrobium sp.]
MAELLGGEEVLGRNVRSELDLVELIHAGLPTYAVDMVLRSGLLMADDLYDLVVPCGTRAPRKESSQALSPEQSDRLVRAVRVSSRAREALGDAERSTRWLRKENRALGGRRPIDLLESDAGTRIVERILGRIEHGVYS